jgi:hypothetical protein
MAREGGRERSRRRGDVRNDIIKVIIVPDSGDPRGIGWVSMGERGERE